MGTKRGNIATPKQMSTLFKFTLCKFWEPEQEPAPTVGEASKILENCFAWMDCKNDPARRDELSREVERLVRAYFPDWSRDKLAPRFGGRKGKKAEEQPTHTLPGIEEQAQGEQGKIEKKERQEATGTKATDKSESKTPRTEKATTGEKPEEKPEQAQEAAQEGPKPVLPIPGAKEVLKARIEAGLVNLWMHGPAGTGKTTVCKEIAEELEIPCTILSCNEGTSPAEITGYQYPEPRTSPVSRAIGSEGIIVLDEVTMLDPSVAAVANALLANGEINTSTGHVVRHDKCIIIATANTVGNGADRVYIGNNQLDGATLDRFTGGFVKVDYSIEYESRFDSEVVDYVQHLRDAIKAHGLRRIVSTRAIIAADKLKAAGIDWKAAILDTWTDDERSAVS